MYKTLKLHIGQFLSGHMRGLVCKLWERVGLQTMGDNIG